MKKSLFFIVLTLMSHSLVLAYECTSPIPKEKLSLLVKEAQETYFPELNSAPLKIKFFKSSAYYLQSQPILKTLTKNRTKREYSVQINTKLLACPPSEEALKAILVHELEHIKDYTKMSSAQIAGLGIKMTISRKFRTKYERATDEKALYKGLGQGLIEYRKWIYKKLTPKQLLKKKRFYYTPEEIAEWSSHH